MTEDARTIWSIGHSSHSAAVFFGFLEWHGIRTICDVRTIPGSRRHPQFGREALRMSAEARGMAYHWMPGLGGRRRRPAGAPSRHVAWEVPAFRAYADYTDTSEFAAALAELEREARLARTAFFCAEALWWRCHRRMIADRLVASGWTVLDVDSGGHAAPHHLPEFARVADGRVIYDVGVNLELPTPPPPPARRPRKRAAPARVSAGSPAAGDSPSRTSRAPR
ncbi:MAG: DUF488 domain-containing protein [Deltaproteobacteria bacterium]|nr:DUF488 domain-containing protein [Deltaproteobacteria bacterium]